MNVDICETPQLDLARFASNDDFRVRIVTPTFDPEPIGTPLYAGELARWLRSTGWDVDVVTAQPFYPGFLRYDGYGRQRRHDAVDEIPVYRLPTIVPRGGGLAWRAVSDLNFLGQGLLARRRLELSPLTVVISPGVPFAIPVARALTSSAGRVVAWVHDLQSGLGAAFGAPTVLVNVNTKVERWCLDLADHVFTLSDGMAKKLCALGVKSPIDTFPLWATLPPDDGRPGQVLADVQYSGNIGRKQGCEQLLDLAERLDEQRPGTTLLIRGNPAARSGLEAAAADRGLRHVTFTDLAPRAELRRALRSGRVYVIPQVAGVGDSVLPSKIVNALAAGCRVVAAGEPWSAVAELAGRHGNLTLTPPGDADALAAAVLHVLRQ